MKQSKAPTTSHPEETSRLPLRDIGSMTFNQLDEAFQRGSIDAATLVRLQCFDRGADARVESCGSARYWDPERAASALLAAVTASSGPVSLDAITRPAPKWVNARPERTRDETFVKAVVLLLMLVASAMAAVSVAAERPSGKNGATSGERVMV
jgi:hypothetical protein